MNTITFGTNIRQSFDRDYPPSPKLYAVLGHIPSTDMELQYIVALDNKDGDVRGWSRYIETMCVDTSSDDVLHETLKEYVHATANKLKSALNKEGIHVVVETWGGVDTIALNFSNSYGNTLGIERILLASNLMK